jgi:hypothetical protein
MPDQPRTDSERILLTLRAAEEAKKDIRLHEDNAARRAVRYEELNDNLMNVLYRIVDNEKQKTEIIKENAPLIKGNQRRDIVEILMYLVIGGAASLISPEFFKFIVQLLAHAGGG